MASALTFEQTARLRRIFQLLRNEYRIKYKLLADDLGIKVEMIYSITSGRSVGTDDVLALVEKYIEKKKLDIPTDEYEYDQSGLDYVLDALGLDPDIIAESESRASGRYILFSYISEAKVSVTWVELFGVSQQFTVPVFKARRPGSDGRDIIYKGFYYEHLSSLFMFGHIEETPLARALVLVPIPGTRKKDRQGVVVGASYPEYAFSYPCYLWALPDGMKRSDFDHMLGEQFHSDISDVYMPAIENLISRLSTAFSLPRTS